MGPPDLDAGRQGRQTICSERLARGCWTQHMSPRLPVQNVGNCDPPYAELLSEFLYRHPASVVATENQTNLAAAEACVPSAVRLHHVSRVIRIRAQPQMLWVDAEWRVAQVSCNQTSSITVREYSDVAMNHDLPAPAVCARRKEVGVTGPCLRSFPKAAALRPRHRPLIKQFWQGQLSNSFLAHT
jgi:hypothetical protein